MTLDLALLGAAAAGTLAFGASACVFALLRCSAGFLDALAPAATARVLLCAALLPCLVTAALMTAAMAPSFGWIADHCLVLGDAHAHPHLCGPHEEPGLPALSLLGVAAAFLLRLALGAFRVARAARLAVGVRKSLEAASSPDATGELRVLPLAEPQAFVVGFAAPTVYVTRGLLAVEHSQHLPAVLAHERAHVRRADPLRKLLCQIGLLFHLPGIAGVLEKRLTQALEMAADATAADELGSGERIARALVHLTRARGRLSRVALAFGTHDVESRVRRLLCLPRGRDFPRPRALLSALGLLVGAIAASADSVHHGVEILLGVMGG